jgi:hypothetical protein
MSDTGKSNIDPQFRDFIKDFFDALQKNFNFLFKMSTTKPSNTLQNYFLKNYQKDTEYPNYLYHITQMKAEFKEKIAEAKNEGERKNISIEYFKNAIALQKQFYESFRDEIVSFLKTLPNFITLIRLSTNKFKEEISECLRSRGHTTRIHAIRRVEIHFEEKDDEIKRKIFLGIKSHLSKKFRGIDDITYEDFSSFYNSEAFLNRLEAISNSVIRFQDELRLFTYNMHELELSHDLEFFFKEFREKTREIYGERDYRTTYFSYFNIYLNYTIPEIIFAFLNSNPFMRKVSALYLEKPSIRRKNWKERCINVRLFETEDYGQRPEWPPSESGYEPMEVGTSRGIGGTTTEFGTSRPLFNSEEEMEKERRRATFDEMREKTEVIGPKGYMPEGQMEAPTNIKGGEVKNAPLTPEQMNEPTGKQHEAPKTPLTQEDMEAPTDKKDGEEK